MNLQELTELVASGESERVEFKLTTGQRSQAARTVCAMLNGLGGFVLFGVTDKGNVAGQAVSAHTLEEVTQELRRIEPPAFPDLETVDLANGSTVIALRVPGGGGPYTYDGRAYVRQGPSTSVMPQRRYERLLLERLHGSHRWENQPAEGFGVADLDHAEILRTINEAIRRQRLEDPGTRDIPALLQGLNLIREGQLLNAAVVLFGKAERLPAYYPQCLLRMARFRGPREDEFLDNRQEHGNAFDLLIRGQRFFRDHLPVAGRIVPHLFERIDDPLYPPAALREALANALCHRDYGISAGSISIGIYDDRLEITSPGPLPFGMTVEQLTRPHPSRPWNPLIAHVFYRRGIIEAWGRGTLRMAEWTAEAGLPPPEFEDRKSEVVVRFRPSRYIPPTQIGMDLSPLQRQLLTVLSETGPASLQQILSHLGAEQAKRTVQLSLQFLRQAGLVDSTGKKGQGSRWMLRGVQTPRESS